MDESFNLICPPTLLPPFLTVPEVATLFRVSKMTVYRMCHTGELESIRVGKGFRIITDALMRTHPISAEQIYSVVNR